MPVAYSLHAPPAEASSRAYSTLQKSSLSMSTISYTVTLRRCHDVQGTSGPGFSALNSTSKLIIKDARHGSLSTLTLTNRVPPGKVILYTPLWQLATHVFTSEGQKRQPDDTGILCDTLKTLISHTSGILGLQVC